MEFEVGQTAVIVPVPEAEPVVGRWRARYDVAAAAGVPAHVTVVYPFLPADRVDEAPLGQEIAGQRTFTVVFAGIGRFPGVLYLAPVPAGPFRDLTSALVRRWPEAPPYGGRFAEVVPHLTVADGVSEEILAEAERNVAAGLPITARIAEAWLIVFDGERWARRASLPLGN